jgi:spore germination protein
VIINQEVLMHIHVVKYGDTLWKIAEYYKADIDAIIEANGLKDPDLLLVGQSLVIPTAETYYTVKQGESIWSIAQSFGVPVQELLWANKIMNPDQVYPGMLLTIPPKKKQNIEVNAFTYMLGEEAVPIINEVGDLLTYLAPFAYLVNEDGSLVPIDDGPAVQESKAQNVIPMMSIVNFTTNIKGENIAHKVLNDKAIVEKLQNNILTTMKTKGYKGINIDFEYVPAASLRAQDFYLPETISYGQSIIPPKS